MRAQATANPFQRVTEPPDRVTAYAENGAAELSRSGERWLGPGLDLRAAANDGRLGLTLHAPDTLVLRFHVRWQVRVPDTALLLGDQWERSYGDLAWRHLEPERVLPWYFLATTGAVTAGCGVKTRPNALCFWQVDPEGVSLWLDVRNGGHGARLGDREVALATVVSEGYSGMDASTAARRFCGRLCDRHRLPAKPVYGGNNWYYAYGKSSADAIRADSERVASWATNAANRPWMVIDDGWEPHSVVGPFSQGNARFPDMAQLAADMRKIGVEPGIWLRPLFTMESVSAGWRLPSPNAAREMARSKAYTLDPTVPEAIENVREDIRRLAAWGYGLIKHDFSTYDLVGRWGFQMNAEVTDDGWGFADRSRTTAEVVNTLYNALREAAGDTLLLGCNTMGHLGAGVFEMQRTGDDTSGRDWNRTRKMGVNTLAFRAPQHGTFFAIDADCVGLTKQVPWRYTRQWLDLLARSGTPLFVSAAPDAVGEEQRTALREAFATASQSRPVGEPQDWQQNTQPQQWKFGGESRAYDWFGSDGVVPFGK